jgi:hypothetical protein
MIWTLPSAVPFACFAGVANRIKHSFDLLVHVIVPESQHQDPLRLQPLRSLLVFGFATDMDVAVQFDGQAPLGTVKVEDVRADDLLPPKSHFEESSGAKVLP